MKEAEKDEDKCAYYDIYSELENVERERKQLAKPKVKFLEDNPSN